MLIASCCHKLYKNAVDKSYSFEVLEDLTPFLILVFFRVTQWKKEDINKTTYLKVIWFTVC